MNFIGPFLVSFAATALLIPLARNLAYTIGAVDNPDDDRRVHTKAKPRLGGLAMGLAILISILIYVDVDQSIVGLLLAFLILLVVGVVDDAKNVSAKVKLAAQVLAATTLLIGGIGIVALTNPFGDPILLDAWRIPIDLLGYSFTIIPLGNLFTIIWIVGMINAVNFLDGLDGLAAGVGGIATLVLFLITYGSAPVVATLAIITLGALLGFFPFNFFPSKIFMGDSGSYTIGLLLAALPMYATEKFVIGSIVLGIAVFDALFVVIRRLLRKQSPFTPDRGHLHHTLLDVGIDHPRVVLIIYLATVLVAFSLFVFNEIIAFGLVLSFLLGFSLSVKMLKKRIK